MKEQEKVMNHIECEELLDTSVLDDVEGPSDEELNHIEINGLVDDIYTDLTDEIDFLFGGSW